MKSWILIPLMLAGLGAGDAPPTTEPATAPAAVAADAMTADSPATAPATTQPVRMATPGATTRPTQMAAGASTTQPARSRFSAIDTSQRDARRGGSSFGGRTYAPPIMHTLLPKEYAILNERSIFLKGHITQFALDEMRPSQVTDSGRRGYDTRGPSGPPPVLVAPEESLVFDGVTQADQHIVAFIEDRNVLKVTMVKVGDFIARGRVTAIDLDTMDYYANGNVTHILIGENLLGNRVSIGDTSSATPTTGPTTAPSGDSSAPGAGGNDVLERLRRRRAQELGGGAGN